MRNKVILLNLLLSIIAISEVQAVGFDCSKAETTKEKLICSDKELSDTNKILDKEYKSALRTYPYKKELKSNQYHWASFYAHGAWHMCADAHCLLSLCRERIALIRAQYSTYFYGGDKYTGKYKWTSTGENEGGEIRVLLIPGNKIKFNILTNSGDHVCGLGEDGEAIASFIDKNHAVFISNDDEECVIILKFDKKTLTFLPVSRGCLWYCGTHGAMDGDYIKISNKPNFAPF